MIYCDTSFLYALYLKQIHTLPALEWYRSTSKQICISELLLMEFRQSVRLQQWLNRRDKTKGFPFQMGQAAINQIDLHVEEKVLHLMSYDWEEIVCLTERLSLMHTFVLGCRLWDIIHVATALHIKVKESLTFDSNQRKLAEAEGLKIPL